MSVAASRASKSFRFLPWHAQRLPYFIYAFKLSSLLGFQNKQSVKSINPNVGHYLTLSEKLGNRLTSASCAMCSAKRLRHSNFEQQQRNIHALQYVNRTPNRTYSNAYSSGTVRSITIKKLKKDSLPNPLMPLAAKRPKKRKTVTEKEGFMKVVAYPLTDHEIDFESLEKVINRQGLYVISDQLDDMEDLLHLKAKYKLGDIQLTKEFFIFREGSVVCWNVPDMEMIDMLQFLRKHLEEPLPMELIKDEMEWMEFTFTEEAPDMIGDVLYIQHGKGKINQHKYVFSNALSQSVKLGVWEASLEQLIESIEPIKKVLKTGMRIPFRRREILKKHGEIFELRFQMNLDSELLDTPDFYWDRDQILETLYKKLYNHLNIGRRTKVMNEKLNYCDQIIEVVDKKATDRSTERLEWMIIILIMIEVGFESIYYLERKTSNDEEASELPTSKKQMSDCTHFSTKDLNR